MPSGSNPAFDVRLRLAGGSVLQRVALQKSGGVGEVGDRVGSRAADTQRTSAAPAQIKGKGKSMQIIRMQQYIKKKDKYIESSEVLLKHL